MDRSSANSFQRTLNDNTCSCNLTYRWTCFQSSPVTGASPATRMAVTCSLTLPPPKFNKPKGLPDSAPRLMASRAFDAASAGSGTSTGRFRNSARDSMRMSISPNSASNACRSLAKVGWLHFRRSLAVQTSPVFSNSLARSAAVSTWLRSFRAASSTSGVAARSGRSPPFASAASISRMPTRTSCRRPTSAAGSSAELDGMRAAAYTRSLPNRRRASRICAASTPLSGGVFAGSSDSASSNQECLSAPNKTSSAIFWARICMPSTSTSDS